MQAFLKWMAVATAMFVVGAMVYQYLVVEPEPGGLNYRLGHQRLEDGRPAEALEEFDAALAENPHLAGAHLGRALALMAQGRDQAALAAFADALEEKPAFGAVYANRGILQDRMGRHREALADYRRALELDPELAEGPGWLTRFFRKQAEAPPTIADRARYLERELQKPPGERVLRVPEVDREQRPYRVEGEP